ncbi:MAG TPA: Fur family transcriptional regulator [Actinomycetota bacterium]|jgi:Fe2+ or Zn2+ uptake regulation protein|nr:Fur family transcriptional regulator [Actinomycetota bacterium]
MSSPAGSAHEAAAERLRGKGQRYTGARRRLIEILSRSRSPLTIPEILRRRRGLAMSSAYRNLAELEDAGIVRRVHTDEGFSRYELNEELTGHHHHLICSNCGRTTDVTLPIDLERKIERDLDAVAARAGFADVGHRLDLIGTCTDCASKRAEIRA